MENVAACGGQAGCSCAACAQVSARSAKKSRSLERDQVLMLVRIGVAAAIWLAGMLLPLEGWPQAAVYLVSYAVIGWDILWRALRNILRGQVFDENFLMTVATIGAIALGEYSEAVFVMVFYQVGEWFQDYAVGRSRRNITALMDIRPDYANLRAADGSLSQVAPEQVAVGDLIVVRPGERVPLDGVVEEGSSSLDTSALTGESAPRDVAVGQEVISGCINQSGLLVIRVSHAFAESTVSRILELVENSAGRKAKSESFITRFSRWYTPIVCAAAVLLAVVPPLVTGQPFGDWIYRALTFLVISCPCALVISVPLSFFGGLGGASKKGILVKGGNYLEALAKVQTVVFDKTGTLTEGRFEVSDVQPQDGFTRDEVLALAAAAERFSGHPIALSIQNAAGQLPQPAQVEDVTELAGLGVRAVVDGRTVLAGNARLMAENGIAAQAADRPGTVVHLGVDGRYAGHLLVEDVVKPQSKEAIAALRALGVGKTVMLTGDSDAVGRKVAQDLGLDEVRTQLMPHQKVEEVEKLLAAKPKNGTLAFVGDGVNDAPVLARADVGVAMGGLGADAAIEAADVVIMDDSPAKLADAVRISRKTRRIVMQNIIFALGVKVIVMALGAMGFASMWAAVFADVGVSLLAILNAMRAMRVR